MNYHLAAENDGKVLVLDWELRQGFLPNKQSRERPFEERGAKKRQSFLLKAARYWFHLHGCPLQARGNHINNRCLAKTCLAAWPASAHGTGSSRRGIQNGLGQSEDGARTPAITRKADPVPGTVPLDPLHPNGAGASKPLPDTHPGTHSQTRVERGAARDAVGDQVEIRPVPKYTFSGVVSIDLERFLASSTQLVECPDCGRTRTLSPVKGVLRFKSHDPRKVQTPVTGLRWSTSGQTDWDVVGGEKSAEGATDRRKT